MAYIGAQHLMIYLANYETTNIYTYHTNIRARYSVNRRNQDEMPKNFGEPVKPVYGK